MLLLGYGGEIVLAVSIDNLDELNDYDIVGDDFSNLAGLWK